MISFISEALKNKQRYSFVVAKNGNKVMITSTLDWRSTQ